MRIEARTRIAVHDLATAQSAVSSAPSHEVLDRHACGRRAAPRDNAVAPSAASAETQSAAGIGMARLPPIVPRLRTAR